MRELYKNHPNARWHESIRARVGTKRILVAFLLNSAFAIIEFIGGVLTGSVAIIADAVHDFGDSVTLAVAWYLEKIAGKEKDNVFSYGYGRFSLVSAVISSVIIMAGMVYIASEAIPRFWEPGEPYGPGMLGLAVLGIIVNGIAANYLAHGHTMNEKVLSWHLIEDVLGWIAVLIGSLFIIGFGWNWVDPLLALCIAAYVGYNAVRNFSHTARLMLQSMPPGFDPEKFLADVEKISGVAKAHDLHVWSMDGDKHILSMHILLDDGRDDFENITTQARGVIGKYGEFHATIEVEKKSEFLD